MSKKYLLLIVDSQKGIDDTEYWGGIEIIQMQKKI